MIIQYSEGQKMKIYSTKFPPKNSSIEVLLKSFLKKKIEQLN